MKNNNGTIGGYLDEMQFPMLSGFFFGLNLALIAGDNIFGLGEKGYWSPSVALLTGAIVGCLPLIIQNNIQARKKILEIGISISAVASFIGCVLYLLIDKNDSLIVLCTLRFFMGITTGLACVAPVYLIEEFPKRSDRGSYFSGYQFAITLGILISYIFMLLFYKTVEDKPHNYYSVVFFICAVVSAIYYYALKHLKSDCYDKWKNYHTQTNRIKEELDNIKSVLIREKQEGKSDENNNIEQLLINIERAKIEPKIIEKEPWYKVYAVPLFLAIAIMAIQQLVGINIIIFELPQLLDLFGVTHFGILILVVVVGCVNVVSTIPGILMIKKFRRKTIFIFGMTGILCSLFLLTVFSMTIKPNYSIIPEEYYESDALYKNCNVIVEANSAFKAHNKVKTREENFLQDFHFSNETIYLKISKSTFRTDKEKVYSKLGKDVNNIKNQGCKECQDCDYIMYKIKLKNGIINEINDHKYYFKFKPVINGDYSKGLLVFMTLIIVYIIFFASTLGILGWLVPAELIPINFRTRGMAIVAATHWFINLIIVLRFDIAYIKVFFVVFLMFSVGALIFGLRYFPETKKYKYKNEDKDKSLKKIDHFWRGGGSIHDFNDDDKFREKTELVKSEIKRYTENLIRQLLVFVPEKAYTKNISKKLAAFKPKAYLEDEDNFGKAIEDWTKLLETVVEYVGVNNLNYLSVF